METRTALAPELSICIPTYNAAHFLPAAIESVIRQGLDDFEILILDNASLDETQALIAGMNNPHIRYIRNETNVGACANHNRCMEEARGKYFKFLCADDVLLDGLLQKQLNALRTHPDVVLATCNMILTDENLQDTGEFRCFPGYAKGSRVIRACLGAMNNYIGGPSNVMFVRSALDGIRFDLKYLWVTDLKCWLEILQRGNYINIDEPGYRYRRHDNTDSLVNCPPALRAKEFLGLVDDFKAWNLLNSLQALRRGGDEGKHLAKANLPLLLRNLHPLADAQAALDIWRWHRENIIGAE